MEPIQFASILALLLGISILIFFVLKSIFSPKKVESILKLIKQKKYLAAEKLAKQIIAKDSKNFLVHYYLGKVYIAMGRTEFALMEYKIVSENAIFGHEISEVQFRKELSELYLKFNQNVNALKEFILLIKLEPKNAEYYYNAGKIYQKENRADKAFVMFKKAISLNKRFAQAHAELGMILFRSQQFAQAKKEIDTAIALNPDSYSSYYYLGKILKEEKDYSGAVKAFEKALRDVDLRQKSLIERGSCFMIVGRLDSAIIDLQRSIELDKEGMKQETLYARYFLGVCYEKNHDIQKAISQWEIIYKKNHSFRDVSSRLAKYRGLQTNDSLKDYLTSSKEDFVEICKKTVIASLSFNVQRCDEKKWGCQIIATEQSDSNWMNVRKQSILLKFYRETNPIDDTQVRQSIDEIKSLNCAKVYIFSSSDFTRTAQVFAEGRPVELFDKDQLEKILQKIGI